jgi:lantibiotic modifying enzyme
VYRHLGGATRRARAAAAIDTALGAVSAESAPDLSLCHGLGGVAEVALVAAGVLGDPGLRSASERAVASVHLPRHGAPLPEIRARHGFQTAGLLLGLAGWTVLHLRLHDPGAASTPFLPAAVDPSASQRSTDVDR